MYLSNDLIYSHIISVLSLLTFPIDREHKLESWSNIHGCISFDKDSQPTDGCDSRGVPVHRLLDPHFNRNSHLFKYLFFPSYYCSLNSTSANCTKRK